MNIAIPLETDTHGVIRVGGTRVTLDTVVYAFQQGATPDEIVDRYPAITLTDVYATIAYYLLNREEVEAYLRASEELAQKIREENEARWPPEGVRERLLARLEARKGELPE
jgi:uncharacterized protein (DUF433 family)